MGIKAAIKRISDLNQLLLEEVTGNEVMPLNVSGDRSISINVMQAYIFGNLSQTATAVAESASTAQTAATTATQKATEASNASTAAEQSKNDASGSATAAGTSADNASQSATNAASSASVADQSAQDAQAAATVATNHSLPHVTLSATDYAALNPPIPGILYITTSGVTL